MDFTWRDGERTIRFGRGVIADAPRLLGDSYVLLTTERAQAAVPPEVVEGAERVLHVAPGLVDELAAEIHEQLGDYDGLIVALGGGRVIDVAKGVAGCRPGARAGAIPTTLSAAEMTAVHRKPAGQEKTARAVRPALVINDPDLSASQPAGELAASSANALAHAALLSGYAIGSAHYGLSHVLSQTLVRVGGAGHGQANAAVLPAAIAALERRFPGHVDPDGTLRALAERLARRAGANGIRRLGVEESALDACADAAAGREELSFTPPAADRDELRALYAEAF